MTYQSTNPCDGTVSKSFPDMTDGELEKAVRTTSDRYGSWPLTTFVERATILSKAASILRTRIEDFARPVKLEMGNLIAESRGEVMVSADIIDHYAGNTERFLAPEDREPSVGEARIESSPIGVIFGVEPWNLPYYQLARLAAPNLMAGTW